MILFSLKNNRKSNKFEKKSHKQIKKENLFN